MGSLSNFFERTVHSFKKINDHFSFGIQDPNSVVYLWVCIKTAKMSLCLLIIFDTKYHKKGSKLLESDSLHFQSLQNYKYVHQIIPHMCFTDISQLSKSCFTTSSYTLYCIYLAIS